MSVTQLEMRLAPATFVGANDVTYYESAGQLVDVHISLPVFTSSNVNNLFTFKTGSVNGSTSPQQLQELDLTQLGYPSPASGASLTITVTPPSGTAAVPVEVGVIYATGIALGAVQVQGDLGGINAGDGVTTPGLASLTVQSMGAYGIATQPSGGSLVSNIQGLLGALTVSGNIDGEFINASGDVGDVTVDGSLDGGAGSNSGEIFSGGNIGNVTIGGSVLGSTGADSGSIYATGNLGNVTVHGSLDGSKGPDSGQIFAGGTMGAVQIGVAAGSGNVVGAFGADSGSIYATGNLASVTLVGSLEGGAGFNSGRIGSYLLMSGNVGPVQIGGNVVGSQGIYSGSIFAAGSLDNVTVGGALEGGAGGPSGAIIANGNMGQVTIGKGVQGAAGEYSGSILAGGTMAALAGETVTVGGALVGGAGNYSGEIVDNGNLGQVTIGGTIGGNLQGAGGQYSGEVGSFHGNLAGVTVDGNLRGGSVSGTQSLANSGYIFGEQITSVTITGSVTAGTNTGTGKLTNSGAIRATYDIGAITVGSLVGNSKNPVFISARGVASPGATDLAIASITVGSSKVSGTVSFTNILAGYNPAGTGVNAAAQIGAVTVYGNWMASNLVAGAGPGADGQFGTTDTVLTSTDAASVLSQIGPIIITGTVSGNSTNLKAHYGFVAQEVTSLKVGVKVITVTPGMPVSLGATTYTSVYALGGSFS
jgi:hypothetical protein